MTSEEHDEIASRLAAVRARIAAAGGDPARVEIVAVTKGFGVAAAAAAIAAGVRDLGENYADELVEKAAALGAHSARWHFLGQLQRNKLARLAPVVARYEALDRLVEGEAIARRAPGAEVLIEVATDPSPGRAGVAPDEVEALCGGLMQLGLDVRGLMTVAPLGGPGRARAAFEETAHLARRLGLAECSMGMSEDLELAVAAGATSVRIGRALFGERAARADARASCPPPALRPVAE